MSETLKPGRENPKVSLVYVSSKEDLLGLTKAPRNSVLVVNLDALDLAAISITEIVRRADNLPQPLVCYTKTGILSSEEKAAYSNAGGTLLLDRTDLVDENGRENDEPLRRRVEVLIKEEEKRLAESHLRMPYPDFVVDTARALVTIEGRDIELRPAEYKLLLYFANQPQGRVVAFEELRENALSAGSQNTLVSYISRIKKRISPYTIETVRKLGYRLERLKDTERSQ